MTSRGASRRTVMAGVALLGASAGIAEASTPAGERTVIFDTPAFFEPVARAWIVPLHAWVYQPQHSTLRKAAIAALFKRHYGLEATPDRQSLFDERINLLLADNQRGRRPRIAIWMPGQSDEPRVQALPATSANGHTRLDAVAPVAPAYDPAIDLADLGLAGPEAQPLARAHLIPPTGVSVISDIDDTVKDSGVLDKRRLWQSTFFEPFRSVTGMASLLRRLAGPEGAVHYVSSSPWHLYQPLRSWLSADGFPVSSLHLKQIRLKDSTIFDILKSPIETKPPVIGALLQRYPQRKFVLVGDSGEKDPEVFALIARKYPGSITRILVRRAPGDTSPAIRFDQAFAGLPRTLWQVFDDPTEIT